MHGSNAPTVGSTWAVTVDTARRALHCSVAACLAPFTASSGPEALREAALAHLARHATRDQLPSYLRTCSCGSNGCPWHRSDRACHGLLSLVLFHSHTGRSWHLANLCDTCARAIPGAARLPTPPSPPPLPSPSRDGRGGGEARTPIRQHQAVRASLGYTGHTLPASVSGEARLLAVLCTLRMRPSGFARLPTGLMRALQLRAPARAIAELQEAGWLRYYGRPCGGPAVFLAELTVRQAPVRAGQWALHCLSNPLLRGQNAPLRLTAL
jgi:hypothetical protein